MYRQALLLVRVLALAGFLLSLATLLANVVQSYDTFNPSYAGFYLKQQLARPLVGIGLALVVALLAPPLARLLARGTEE
ncbi:MAG: hypothetical protein WC205_00890 [Opitutaceae bacterium]|jgi:hypothetical protein